MAENSCQPPPQPRRKISLPWFRQSSFGLGVSAGKRLPKQHTIAGSDFNVHCNDKDDNISPTSQETWVLADSNANGPGELSVQRGQQVEVVAASAASNNMVVVRVSASGQEGMVPLTCLKQPVGGFKFRNGGGAFPGEGKPLCLFI